MKKIMLLAAVCLMMGSNAFAFKTAGLACNVCHAGAPKKETVKPEIKAGYEKMACKPTSCKECHKAEDGKLVVIPGSKCK